MPSFRKIKEPFCSREVGREGGRSLIKKVSANYEYFEAKFQKRNVIGNAMGNP